MKAKAIVTRSPEETRALAARIGKAAKVGDMVLLVGPLGAGKTTFAQGFAKGAGFRGPVVSPSFALTRRYQAGKKTIHHLDLYRLADKDLANLGLEEYFEDPMAICLVEWPEIAEAEIPRDQLKVELKHVSEGDRRIRFQASGPRAQRLLDAVCG